MAIERARFRVDVQKQLPKKYSDLQDFVPEGLAQLGSGFRRYEFGEKDTILIGKPEHRLYASIDAFTTQALCRVREARGLRGPKLLHTMYINAGNPFILIPGLPKRDGMRTIDVIYHR